MPSVAQLADLTEVEFGFLTRTGWTRVGREILFPESLRGGFVLHYAKSGHSLELRYLDIEFEVRIDGAEVYGPSIHPEFSGNQFSPEHLLEHLPQLARVVQDHAHL